MVGDAGLISSQGSTRQPRLSLHPPKDVCTMPPRLSFDSVLTQSPWCWAGTIGMCHHTWLADGPSAVAAGAQPGYLTDILIPKGPPWLLTLDVGGLHSLEEVILTLEL